jgi:hypothetical protein
MIWLLDHRRAILDAVAGVSRRLIVLGGFQRQNQPQNQPQMTRGDYAALWLDRRLA